MKNIAACCCGQLTLIFEGEITKTSICHCFQCQKRSGSVFAVQTRLETKKILTQGESTVFKRKGEEGAVTLHFCPKCGSTVFWELDGLPGSTIVSIGSFANPQLPSPTFSVYKARKHHWVEIPSTVTDDWD